jgi:hypothetical protein
VSSGYTGLMALPRCRASAARAPSVLMWLVAAAASSLVVVPSAQMQRNEWGEANTISPSVIENAFAHREPSGSWRLDLLVLWRGTPGWFLAGGANGTSSSGGTSRPVFVHNRHADVDFDVFLDRGAGIARVAATTIRLDEKNIVLIDGMPHQQTIVGTRLVTSPIDEPPIGLQAIFRASPELDAFLRCNETQGNPVLDGFRAPCTWGPAK